MKGGAQDCPYTFMQDLVAGRYRLPWEDEVKVTDGTSLRLPGRRRAATARSIVGGGGVTHDAAIAADPYPWPYNGDLRPDNTALIVIDMQTDFCGKGGYVDAMGYDLVADARADRADPRACWRRCGRRATTSSTRAKATAPTSPTCPPTSAGARQRIGAGIGDPGPCGRILVRGEPGWEIIPELAPLPGEIVIDKPGKGSFCATDLELILRTRGIANLVLTGITTDVCVHTTMREANDRGFECLLLEDCCGATDHGNHLAAIKMVTMQGGVFGAVADAATPSSGACHDRKSPRRDRASRPSASTSASAASPRSTSVSLKVAAGSMHALLGENGAGKSTLVKCLLGYYRPDERQLPGRRPGGRDRPPGGCRRARPRHGLPALHAGARHDGGREPGACRAPTCRR